jgi:hypothetical protein
LPQEKQWDKDPSNDRDKIFQCYGKFIVRWGTGLPGFQGMMGVFGPIIHRNPNFAILCYILLCLDPLWEYCSLRDFGP